MMTDRRDNTNQRKQPGTLTKIFIALSGAMALAIGAALAAVVVTAGAPDGPADCPSIGDTCADGTVYVGTRELKDGDGTSLGEFFLFTPPTDLRDDQGNRLLLKFNEAVDHVAGLHEFYGHDGGRFEDDSALHDAIFDGRYNGEWFIPPKEILAENIFKNRDEGALRGTFATEDGYPHYWWTLTQHPESPQSVHIVNHIINRMPVRPVRAEPRPIV